MIAAICDDELWFRKELREFLVEYKKTRRISLDIVEYSDGKTLLDAKDNFDIIFLDYEMPGVDGLSTARILRARKNFSCIIYITSYSEYVFESFEVGTYRYFVKPIDKIKLFTALDAFVKEKKMFAPIVVNVDGEQLTISSEDIIYLEAEGKFCNIRTTNNFVRSSKTLSKVYELLPQHCFFRPHRSYVVNFYCIASLKDNIITLTNGEKLKISRNNITDFKEAYKAFLKHFIARM